jgi:recombination protein RecT
MGQITTEEYLGNVQKEIENELARNIQALPEGFNKQRFILNCITVMKDNVRDFSGINPITVAAAFVEGAYLGLDFFNKECYAIPYGGNVNFQTDYKGEIKLAKRYSSNPIKDIYAKNVREGDFFEERIENGNQIVNFRPEPFSDKKIIGTFAVVLYKDGSMMYDTMSVSEIEHTRTSYSKAANSKAWKQSPGEMYKKTVLRRLCKMIDLDFDNIEQRQAFDDGSDFDPNKNIIDGEAKDVVTDPFKASEESTEAEEVDSPQQ